MPIVSDFVRWLEGFPQCEECGGRLGVSCPSGCRRRSAAVVTAERLARDRYLREIDPGRFHVLDRMEAMRATHEAEHPGESGFSVFSVRPMSDPNGGMGVVVVARFITTKEVDA